LNFEARPKARHDNLIGQVIESAEMSTVAGKEAFLS
jgi:hypothetical protein